ALRYDNPKLQMPPGGKLPAAEIELLTEWVRAGAVLPEPAPVAGSAGSARADPRKHWAFQPLRVTNPPGEQGRPSGNRVDAYLRAALRRAGLEPVARAEPRVLLRRASLDLRGLPPTPEEIQAWDQDARPDAWSRLVDRLLDTPQYGERWGRHWLDLVRYCDIPESWAQTAAQAWLYRDWVVEALNRDLPYDRFVRLQLAADEIPGVAPQEYAALGFLGLSPTYWKELKLAPDVIETVVAEEWEERVSTFSGALLGLTAACARCHDHKFDPISTRDYYALAGVFASTRQVSRPLLPEAAARQVLAAHERVKQLEAEAKTLQMQAGKEPSRAAELRERAGKALAEAASLQTATPHFAEPMAYGVETASLSVLPDGPDRTRLEYANGVGRDVALQLRGNPANPGPVVPRGFLSVLTSGRPVRFTQGSGRRELADALFREGAPLAARVIVNRVWRHHFGRGLVETPSNFGLQGDRPTRPELLDDLAHRFIAQGWSLKWLHREIMNSDAYQRASHPTEALRLRDADNRLLGRMNRRRLEVEAWRDSILAAAGTLDLRVGGAPRELSAVTNRRRTLYGVVKRRDLDDLLRLYDFPDPTGHSPARFHTTTPLQQLYVLNSEFIARQAAALAARVAREAGEDPVARLERACLLLYGRRARPAEQRVVELHLAQAPPTQASETTWAGIMQVLLSRSEFLHTD
ncbi:MAG: DUF1553 domain-containing protein, partial [Armatimonadetes bacterium]|nr:DUF1553 domain-containing protein [Armatimonadota bacterium]